jgi:methylmalonyl-CoA/ethylmalonyl-CoA epimerase
VLFGRIDHIGVAVEDIDEAIDLYREKFDMREQRRETVEAQDVEGHVELIRPLSDDSGVAKWLAKNGPGMHHVAYQTDDIDSALETVREAGLRLIDKEPRVGIGGARVAFIHPKATGGVLTELVEPVH